MDTRTVIAIGFTLAAAPVFAQDATRIQKMFEAGRFQQVVESVSSDSAPEALYTLAQSHQRLNANDQAIGIYQQLAMRGDEDAWTFVGRSGQQLLEGDADGALDSARHAVEMNGDLAEAHFQLGLVLAARQDWTQAAPEFDRVTELNPAAAYAHYYGGLMHYRAGRPDRMANHFEQFLKIAPDAPERPEVTQIMRTVRGR